MMGDIVDIQEGMKADKAKITGTIILIARDKDGNIKDQREIKNLVVTVGKAGVASRINGDGAEAAFTFIAVGTGTTAPVAGNTILETEIASGGLTRAAATASRITTDTTNDTAKLDKTFSVTATFAVTEAGAFNAGAAGVLLGRQTFAAVNVVNTDTLQVIYNFDVD